MTKYLRHKAKGTIYGWNEYIARSPDVEEVTEEEAYPERFVTKKARGRKSGIDLSAIDLEPKPDNTPPELAAEASRGL